MSAKNLMLMMSIMMPSANAQAAAAMASANIAQEQLAWAKETYAADKAVTDRVVEAAMKRQADQDEIARKDRERYETVFQPLEDNLIKESEGYTDERNAARGEAAAGKATAEVSSQMQAGREAAEDRLRSFGVNPGQALDAALDRSGRLQEAASRAGAANTTRDQTIRAEEQTGRDLRTQALNIGRGYPAQIAQSSNTALQSGNQAVNSGIATSATGGQLMGSPVQWQSAANQGYGNWGSLLSKGISGGIDYGKAEDARSSGWGAIAGTAAGMAGKYISSRYAEGGVVPEMHDGVPVDPSLSPSGGEETDDVPARLNAGEFILPEDVVQWKGEEFFQKLIENSRKMKAEAGAQPRMQALPVERPSVRTAALPQGVN